VDDNSIAIPLFGERDRNIRYIEKSLNLKINARGNILFIEGKEAERAKNIILNLIKIIREKKILENEELETEVRLSTKKDKDKIDGIIIKTPKRKISARSIQ